MVTPTFEQALAIHFKIMFAQQRYAGAAAKHTPASLAREFTAKLSDGSNGVSITGPSVIAACQQLGIKRNYKAIAARIKQDADTIRNNSIS